MPIPPPELRPSTYHELRRSHFPEVVRLLKNRADRVAKLVELGAPETVMEGEAHMEAEALETLVNLCGLPTTSHPQLELRDEVRVEQPPPGSAGPRVAYLSRIWAPKTGELRGPTVLLQLPDELRLQDETGIVKQFPPCGWSLAAGDRQWAVFLGDNPRVENGEVRDVAVLDTMTGAWRETWPSSSAFEHHLLGSNTFTVVERIDDSWCITDLLHNRSRVLEAPDTLVAWSPLQDVVWGRQGGAYVMLRTLGGVAPLATPDEFDQAYDADTGEVSRGRRSRGTTVEPALAVDHMEGAVHISADGRIGVGDDPVLELGGTIDAVAIEWPFLAVLTPTHVSLLELDSFDEDGFGENAEMQWRRPL